MNDFGEVIKEANLKDHNTYRLNSTCRYLIKVSDINKLQSLIKYLEEAKLKYFIIGNGSNIILPSYYDGIIIKLILNDLLIDGTSIEVGSSYMINKLSNFTVNNDLKGLEWAAGIPGEIGGSIVGNASCYGGELMPLIKKIDILENNIFKTITTDDFEYSYRYTSLKDKNIIILKIYLEFAKGNKEELLNEIKLRTIKRVETQPLEYPNAGSVFKNPEGDSAGRLIEEAGLKGLTVGGAEVSNKHANFIINKSNATSEDIKELITIIHNTILKKYDIDLILEQEIIN